MSGTSNHSVILTSGASITPEPIDWLWKHWLAKGKFHILAGDSGVGKTSIVISFCASVTSGGQWPDGSTCESGNVLIWSGEDDPADTLLPRLLAAGGTPSNCHFVSGIHKDGKDGYFDPKHDMPALEAAARRIGNVKLLLIDPVVATVKGDGHVNTEVRRDLQPIVDFARSIGCAAIGITHLKKGDYDSDPMSRISGSIAFAAVARVVMIAAKIHSDDAEGGRVLVRCKSNIGPEKDGFSFAVEQAEPVPKVHTTFIMWGYAVKGTARELLRADSSRPVGNNPVSAVDHAKAFLAHLLAAGPTSATLVDQKAEIAGISGAAIRRGAQALGIIKWKTKDGWSWKLPQVPTQDAQATASEKHEHLDPLEPLESQSNDPPEDDFDEF